MEIVIDFLIKWALGIVTAGISYLFIKFRKEIFSFKLFRDNKKKKELLSEVNSELEGFGERISEHEEAMHTHEETVSKEIHQHDKIFFQKLAELEERIMKVLLPIQEATLSSHYDALLSKCKYYIRQGEISADELDLLEKDYATYKNLNGNGHMELWITRVRQLPVK